MLRYRLAAPVGSTGRPFALLGARLLLAPPCAAAAAAATAASTGPRPRWPPDELLCAVHPLESTGSMALLSRKPRVVLGTRGIGG